MFAMYLDTFTAEQRAEMTFYLRLARRHLAYAAVCRLAGARTEHAGAVKSAKAALADFYMVRARARRMNLELLRAASEKLGRIIGGGGGTQ